MIIRKIRPEELKRTSELFSLSFEIEGENEDSAEEVMQDILEHPESREDKYWSEKWAAFKEDDKTMMSYFVAQPFPVQFDGTVYQMTGIGGVATLPQFRKNGGIRCCFQAALPAMYQEGVVFSYLFPFSTAFYRKFGYEMGCECNSWRINLDVLPDFAVTGNCDLVEPGHFLLEEIQTVYRVWQKKYNMMIANEEYEYAWVKRSNPVMQQVFTYVYIGADGTPKGYMTYRPVDGETRNLLCKRFCFTDLEGLKGLLNLLRSLRSDHEAVILELPIDVDLTYLLPECAMKGPVESTRKLMGMVRVVNVEQVLYGARYRGSGTLSLEIRDDQIKENNGIFKVVFQDGKATQVNKVSGQTNADISMGIQQFSRLIIGAGDLSALPYMEQVELHGNLPELEKVFYRKPNLILEYF